MSVPLPEQLYEQIRHYPGVEPLAVIGDQTQLDKIGQLNRPEMVESHDGKLRPSEPAGLIVGWVTQHQTYVDGCPRACLDDA
jgi:hypothetical protein